MDQGADGESIVCYALFGYDAPNFAFVLVASAHHEPGSTDYEFTMLFGGQSSTPDGSPTIVPETAAAGTLATTFGDGNWR